MRERIKELRLKLKLSQAELGKKLDLTGAQICNIEHGRNRVTDRIKRITCKEFNVNPKWLETGEGNMFNKDMSKKKEYSPYQIAILNNLDELPTHLQEIIMNITEEYTRLYRATVRHKPTLLGGRGTSFQSKSQPTNSTNKSFA